MSFKNFSLTLFIISSFFFPYVNPLFFNISRFDQGSKSLIEHQGDALINGGRIKLTNNSIGSDSKGRAVYKKEVILWDEKSLQLSDFTTHFSFIIKCVNGDYCGDGLTFFLAKHTATIPKKSEGGLLALFAPEMDFSSRENGTVAVEFDTFKNSWDPSANHVGIDVNSISSVANITWDSSIKDGRTANAWVTYHSSTKNLSVFLTYDKHPIYRGNSSLSYNVDLRDVLPSKVAVGFTASTGLFAESHEIISWSFSSRLEGKTQDRNNQTVAEAPKKAESPERAEAPKKAESPERAEAPEKPRNHEAAKSPEVAKSPDISEQPENITKPENGDKIENSENTNKSNVGLIVGLSASIGAIILFL